MHLCEHEPVGGPVVQRVAPGAELDRARREQHGRLVVAAVSSEPRLRGESVARLTRNIAVEREPLLGFPDCPALAGGVVLDLVALDLADPKIAALRMAEIKAADGSPRRHRVAFGQPHADPVGVEQAE